MIKWISFQSLVGGMAIGAEEAFGCHPVMCIDYEGVANSELYYDWLTKTRGLKNIPHIILDGGMFSHSKTIKPEYQTTFDALNKDISVVCAVPVCSGLSQANASKSVKTARGSSAFQNNNMLGIAEFALKYINPNVYLFENAPALFSKTSEGIRSQLNEIAKQFGYSVSYIKTNTLYHGLPQKRQRTFCIMWRGDEVGVIENPVENNAPTFDNLLSHISNLQGSEFVPFKNFADDPYIKYCYAKYGKEHYRQAFTDNIVDVLRRNFKNNDVEFAKEINKDNKKFCDYLDYAKSKFDKGMNVMDGSPMIFYGDHPCCTIFARNQRRIVHPIEERGLNLREMMRLMGMPDDFPIDMKHEAMIGQNVPVPTARWQCFQIKKFLEGRLKTLKTDVNFQALKPANSHN